MMKTYAQPKLDILAIEVADILTTSNTGGLDKEDNLKLWEDFDV